MPVSMVDGKLFDKLEYIARVVRNSEIPFGGIQVCLVLPPTERNLIDYCIVNIKWRFLPTSPRSRSA
jgi:hypothetical protein